MQYRQREIFGFNLENLAIYFTDCAGRSPFSVLVVNKVADLHFAASSDGFQSLPIYQYSPDGTRHDNLTDWALKQFQAHYPNEKIEKRDIFHYVYAVLHDPRYREKFALNLKAEFPRIPFHPDFHAWASIGAKLIELHVHFEQVSPYPLKRVEIPNKTAPKCRLKADKMAHTIEIDTHTRLEKIPPQAWQYQLGNRSALEWVLDQYKEKTPRDPTIREKFNTYRFADYKEQVIELLAKVCRVSVKTMELVEHIQELGWE